MLPECIVYHICRPCMELHEGYIGVTRQPLERRVAEHQRSGNAHLRSALALYDDIVVHVVDAGTVQYCLEKEQMLRPDPNMGWNIAPGGGLPPVAQPGRVYSDEAKQKLLERNQTLSSRPEQRERLSLLHKGKAISDEHKAILSKAHKGKPKSESTKLKMSTSMTGIPRAQAKCKHCGAVTTGSNIARWHNTNCRHQGVSYAN